MDYTTAALMFVMFFILTLSCAIWAHTEEVESNAAQREREREFDAAMRRLRGE